MSEARKAIDHVVKVLNGGGNESRLLWHVLTALRGPDNDDNSVKHRSTTHLRGAIGLKHYDGFIRAVVSHGKPRRFSDANERFSREAGIFVEVLDAHVQYHFRSHFDLAVEALEELDYIERDAANLSEPDTK
jgi:hypothetical protein